MLDRYRALRHAGKTLATKLTRAMPRSVIVSAARNLGLWRKGVLTAEQYELDVLMDRAIYDEKWDGKGALDRFLESSPAAGLTEDERRFCEIMKTAHYSLFQVVGVRRGGDVAVLSPTDVVQPDILFVAAARLSIIGEKYISEAPDLVVEVLSPATADRDQDLKKKLYSRFGVREF